MKNTKYAAKLLRYYSILSTTKAGSGHPTSCLSSADLMASLFFDGYFKYDIENPDNLENDRLIFSKGHAAPLYYSMWALAGGIKHEELETLRLLNSRLEGHPTMKFPFTEVPTGSLGQGLSVGVGMALSAKYLDKTASRTFVLMGDSEVAEGSVWEAMEIASHYHLDNLVGILDCQQTRSKR
ncbi:MAG: 1-deoxy-D-xylulose-5-phosphate synthase N-terminal domain-containing protein [Patescibacteria group bacterium]